MRWKGFSIGLIMLMLLGSILIIDIKMDLSYGAEAITLYVDDDIVIENSTHKKTIQSAVDNASDWDTIFVYNGIYRENIIINKTLNVIGEDNFDTKINGIGQIGIFIEDANYVNITSFYIHNVSTGIHVESSYNCNLSNNRIYGLRGEDHVAHGDDGGKGVHTEFSSVFIFNCNIYGGDGGTGTYEGGILLSSYGGNGGQGIYALNSTLKLNQGYIRGGKGGNAEEAFEWSWGGSGGIGLYLHESMANSTKSNIRGGNPGQGYHFPGNPATGIFMFDSKSDIINGTILGGQNGYSLTCDNSIANITNCTLMGLVFNPPFIPVFNENALYLIRNSNIIVLNSNFNRSRVYFVDKSPNLTVQWYISIKSTDNSLNTIPNAIVCIKDLQNSLPIQKNQTDSTGYIRWLVETEYVERDINGDRVGERTYYTPHKITAWNETLLGLIEVVINESKEVNVILDTPSIEILLHKGWNLVSLPLVQMDTSISNVLSSITGNYNKIEWYNTSEGQWHTTYDDLTDLDHTVGFWIHMKTNDTLVVTGDIPNSTSIQLYKGWNMVGNPKLCNWEIDDILSSIAGNYTAIQWFDASDKSDPWKHFHVDKPPQMNDLKYMTCGRGYWINVKQDCVWELDNF